MRFFPWQEVLPKWWLFPATSCSRLVFGHPVLLFQTRKDNCKGNKFLYFSVSLLVVRWDDNINTKTDRVNDDDDDDYINNNNIKNNNNNNSNNCTSGNLMFCKEQNGDVRWWAVASGLVSRKVQSFNSGCSCSKSHATRHGTARHTRWMRLGEIMPDVNAAWKEKDGRVSEKGSKRRQRTWKSEQTMKT